MSTIPITHINHIHEEFCLLGYNASSASCLLHVGFFPGLLVDPDKGGYMFLPKLGLTFNGLHDIIFQKIDFFITTAVRISDST
jgi:hypothetical protein